MGSDDANSGTIRSAAISTSGEPSAADENERSQDPSSEDPDSRERAPEAPSLVSPAPTVPGAELSSLTLETLAPEQRSSCDRDYQGLGVELRAWGDVMLPYTPGYPTTSPGEVWDCTPNSVFGAAIAMTHAAYLEGLRPDLIPQLAVDNSGRAARIENHSGTVNESGTLGFECSPIGWNWDGDVTWSLLHECGERDHQVAYFQMQWTNDRWQLVYPPDGTIISGDPPQGYAYYPFLEAG